MKILAVDDDPIILALIEEVLSKIGKHDVTCCGGADEALATVDATDTPFDCILLDIQMPVTDGIELCRILRTLPRYRSTPILMITAMSDKSYMSRAFDAGATDYVTKPFDIMELSTRISVAAKIVREQKTAKDRIVTIRKLRLQAQKGERRRLDDVVTIHDVDRVIDFTSFENYLLRLPRGALFTSSLAVIGIKDVRRLYQRSTEYEFNGTVADVAEAISSALKPATFFVAYAGNGLYACLIEANRKLDTRELNERIRANLAEMELCFNDGRPMFLSTEVGTAHVLGFRSGRRAVELLVSALAEVESHVLHGEPGGEPELPVRSRRLAVAGRPVTEE